MGFIVSARAGGGRDYRRCQYRQQEEKTRSFIPEKHIDNPP
jgi:hypothetical protein